MEPPAIRESVPLPTEEVPRIIAPLFVKLTALAPELFKETAEVKLLAALVSVIAAALPLKLAEAAPAACVIAVLAA